MWVWQPFKVCAREGWDLVQQWCCLFKTEFLIPSRAALLTILLPRPTLLRLLPHRAVVKTEVVGERRQAEDGWIGPQEGWQDGWWGPSLILLFI